MSREIWRKDYESFYREHREKGGSVYDIDWCRSFVGKYIATPKSEKTLLDVGCGDGIWSIVLSDRFKVTGVDNSAEGIRNANILREKRRSDATFVEDSIEIIDTKYDIVFCRCPEFFGGYSPDSEVFQRFLPIVLNLCRETFYFIVYSKEPFGRYYNEEKTSYFHDPEVIDSLLSEYGRTETVYEDNYIVSRLEISDR